MTASELAALYRAHGRRLFGMAWQLTGDGAAAEDAVQETFLRALGTLARRDGYQERGQVRAWLDRILVNVVRDLGRRRLVYQRRVAPVLAAAGGESDPAPGPERAARGRELAARVVDALATMPATYREVLVLRHFEDRSTAEVAVALGLPEGTVRSRLKRARQMLAGLAGEESP